MNSIIRPLTDCGERLQSIELTLRNRGNILLISAYLPSSSSKVSVLEYHKTNDQLHELFQKYQDTHTTVIRGNLNEDLT